MMQVRFVSVRKFSFDAGCDCQSDRESEGERVGGRKRRGAGGWEKGWKR
jgi:hypothetical protein